MNCGSRCINKLISTECDPKSCRCEEACDNMRFQRHDDACVYPIPTGGKGWGLCAGEDIKKGIFDFSKEKKTNSLYNILEKYLV